MLSALNWLLEAAHILVLLINLTFWWSFKTLWLAQVTQILTLISWFGFGVFYGFGYCFLTDWHWQVKAKLGERDLPASYLKYLADKITNRNWAPETVDAVAFVVFTLAILGCIVQTRRQLRRTAVLKTRQSQPLES